MIEETREEKSHIIWFKFEDIHESDTEASLKSRD